MPASWAQRGTTRHRVPPAAFRDSGAWREGHLWTPAHVGGCPPLRECHLQECEGLCRDYVGWADEPWPIEHEQNDVEDCGWVLFSESKDMLNLAWTELAIEPLQVFTKPDPSGPDDPVPFWNERDSSSGGGSAVPRERLGVPPVRIEDIGAGELKDMVQDWIDWDYQHIRQEPRYLRDRWVRPISYIIDEVRDPPLEEYERLRRLPGHRKKPPTPLAPRRTSD